MILCLHPKMHHHVTTFYQALYITPRSLQRLLLLWEVSTESSHEGYYKQNEHLIHPIMMDENKGAIKQISNGKSRAKILILLKALWWWSLARFAPPLWWRAYSRVPSHPTNGDGVALTPKSRQTLQTTYQLHCSLNLDFCFYKEWH